MNEGNQSLSGKGNVCRDFARIIMKGGNILNVVEITPTLGSSLRLLEPLIAVTRHQNNVGSYEA